MFGEFRGSVCSSIDVINVSIYILHFIAVFLCDKNCVLSGMRSFEALHVHLSLRQCVSSKLWYPYIRP